jgi:hypothetical protein
VSAIALLAVRSFLMCSNKKKAQIGFFMPTYEIKYQFTFSEIPVSEKDLKRHQVYETECLAEVQVSENVESQCLNAARLDFVDDYGFIAPFLLDSFNLISFIKKN